MSNAQDLTSNGNRRNLCIDEDQSAHARSSARQGLYAVALKHHASRPYALCARGGERASGQAMGARQIRSARTTRTNNPERPRATLGRVDASRDHGIGGTDRQPCPRSRDQAPPCGWPAPNPRGGKGGITFDTLRFCIRRKTRTPNETGAHSEEIAPACSADNQRNISASRPESLPTIVKLILTFVKPAWF